MARKSLSAQLAELREYTAKLEIELAGLREVADRARLDRAQIVARKPAKFSARVQTRSEAAREYCKHHNVTSVSKQQLDAWMMQ